jgi:hypothetical protein
VSDQVSEILIQPFSHAVLSLSAVTSFTFDPKKIEVRYERDHAVLHNRSSEAVTVDLAGVHPDAEPAGLE